MVLKVGGLSGGAVLSCWENVKIKHLYKLINRPFE